MFKHYFEFSLISRGPSYITSVFLPREERDDFKITGSVSLSTYHAKPDSGQRTSLPTFVVTLITHGEDLMAPRVIE